MSVASISYFYLDFSHDVSSFFHQTQLYSQACHAIYHGPHLHHINVDCFFQRFQWKSGIYKILNLVNEIMQLNDNFPYLIV